MPMLLRIIDGSYGRGRPLQAPLQTQQLDRCRPMTAENGK